MERPEPYRIKRNQAPSKTIISLMYTNADGLCSKLPEIKDQIKVKNPDVICITETKLKPDIADEALGLEHYNIWRKERTNKEGGGIMIMAKKELIATEVELLRTTYAEALAIEIKSKKGSLLVATTYIAPETNAWSKEEHIQLRQESIDTLKHLLQRVETKSQEMILTGDFNCSIDWNTREAIRKPHIPTIWNENILDLASDFSLHQHINENTRARGTDNPSMPDQLFTRQQEDIVNLIYNSPLGMSDHAVINITYSMEVENNVSQYKRKYNYRKGDYKGLKEYFSKVDWKRELDITDINMQNEKFMKFLNEGEEQFMPKTKQNRALNNNQKWFNRRCAKARANKELLWKRYKNHPSDAALERYKEARNSYTRETRETVRSFEKDIIDKSEKEPKLFYNYINSKTKKKEQILTITDEGITYDNEKDMSEILNKKFQSVFTKEPSFDENQEGPVPKQKLRGIKLTKERVLKILKSLDKNKSMGPDGISPWILKECAEELCEPLFMIFTNSLQQGKLPKIWKKANITPLYKKGNKSNPLNYRPVSLTSIVCKILETLIREEWVDMLEKQNMFTGKQFGFRQGRSCVSNLLCFYDRITDAIQERKGWADSIYLDFSKAFDKVPHKRLIWKLKHVGGVDGTLLEWMIDFLQDRQMSTVIRGTASECREVTGGVPQGTVLAPIMFLIYINDLGEDVSNSSYISMFADDAKIQRRIINENSCKELQEDINKIKAWSEKWKMEFNVDKCHVLRFGESSMRPVWQYKLGEETVPSAEKEKDLGVVINHKLEPEDHVNQITGKMHYLLANMKIAFTYIDASMVRKIITTFIRPTLEYAAVAWNPYHQKDEKKIERIQRAATRWVPELRELSYEERLQALNLPTLKARRERGALITIYKCTTGMMDIDKTDFLQPNTSRTRGHSKKLLIKDGKKDVKKHSFPNKFIKSWNDLPEHIVSAKNIHQFKKLYDEMIQAHGTT